MLGMSWWVQFLLHFSTWGEHHLKGASLSSEQGLNLEMAMHCFLCSVILLWCSSAETAKPDMVGMVT